MAFHDEPTLDDRRLGEDALRQRAKGIRWMLFDVDGVLTDGRIWYSAEGETLKAFHARDGLAMKLAQRRGLKVGLLTGRTSAPLHRRAQDLGLASVISGSRDKEADFRSFLEQHALEPEAVAFVGDDLPDLPVLRRCGLALAPADGAREVRVMAHRVLATSGGHGVAREAIELVMRAQETWRPMADELFGG